MSKTIPKVDGLPFGKRVSRLCFGTLTMGPLQRDMRPEEGAQLLLYAAARGVNFLDTADLYGNYPHIRLALRQADYVVATKAYAHDEKTAQEAFSRAVKGMGREYIDLFLLHEQESEHTLRGHEGALAWLLKKKDEGLIGAVGLSTHHIAGVRAATAHGGLDVLHPLINQTGIGIADGARQGMEAAIAEAADAGLFIYAMKPLGGGHLIAKRREAFAYALGVKGVHALAVGMQSEAEIDYNVALLSGREPDESLALGQKRRLLVHDWCQGCGACVARCAQCALSIDAGGKASVDAARCVLCGYCAQVCPLFCLKVI